MKDIYVGALFSDSYLEHHGILGMKWGVRRFENKDGSLTAAGKKRYGGKKSKRRTPSQVKEDSMRKDVKNRHILSDKELDAKINRLRKENELKRLTDENLNSGRTEVANILKGSGKQVLSKVAAGAGLYAVKVILTKNFNLQDAAGYLAPRPKQK